MRPGFILAIILDLIFLVIALVITLQNPAMTQTQLLLAYWWFWIPGALICCLVTRLAAD